MNATNLADPCASQGVCLTAPVEFVRLRYFFGQRLGVVDLADEQSYFAGKQRFHNLHAHGAGVLCGLRAERYVFPQGTPPAQPTTLLRVRRGAALDPCGREILVGWDQCIDVAAWYAQHPKAHPASANDSSLRLWVALCYRECPSDPAPAPRDPCGCDVGGCEFARIREGFELKLLTDVDVAAQVKRAPAGSSALDGSDGTLAQMAARLAAADCPEPPGDACLLLADFRATLDAAGKTVADITAPDNTIPERLSLLSTATLQRGLLDAFAAVSDAELLGLGPRLGDSIFAGTSADAGTLSVPIHSNGAALARDPFTAGSEQLKVSVHRFNDADGSWAAANPNSQTYVAGAPGHIDLAWTAGLQDGGRYRVLIAQTDPAQPPVDTLMRPLTPPSWVRHVRLVKDATSGDLVLAASLYP
jgi:hypothetical protein